MSESDDHRVLGAGRFLELRVTARTARTGHRADPSDAVGAAADAPEDEPARARDAESPLPIAPPGWEYVHRPAARGAVAVLAITERDEIVLVEQLRPAVRSAVIELPAGLVGDQGEAPDEAPARAAERELLEETGYRAERFEHLARGPSSPGLSDEIMEFYRASGLRRVGPGGGDASEQIIVHVVPLGGLREWLDERGRAGRLVEPKIYAALALARVSF